MISEQLFRSNPQQRDGLKKLLEDQIMVTVISILTEKAKARRAVEPRAGVPHDTSVSQHYHVLHGRQLTLDDLVNLTQPPAVEGVRTEEDEFEHGLPEPIRRARELQRQQAQT